MEPERKIEKLLRAFARKRRTDAGEAFKLHPAMRRQLQQEVARRAPKPNKDKLLWQFFGGMSPGLSAGMIYGAFFILCLMAAALVLPALSKAKQRGQMMSAMGNLKQIGAATREFAAENGQQLPVALSEIQQIIGTNQLLDPASGQPFVYVAGGRAVDSLRPDSVLAYSPEEGKNRAVLFADGHVEAVNRQRFSEITNRGLIQLALADASARRELAEVPPASVPAPAAVAAANEYGAAKALEPPNQMTTWSADALEKRKAEAIGADLKESPTTVVAGTLASESSPAHQLNLGTPTTASGLFFDQRAVQSNLPGQAGVAQSLTRNASNNRLQNLFWNATASAKVAPVLANFEFQQNGAAVAVVDGDGSVYNGYLLANEPARRNVPGAAKKLPVAAVPGQDKDAAVNQAAGPAAQNYFFRVAGTNRSLKQNVVFTGNVLTFSNSVTAGGVAGGVNNLSPALNQSQLGIFSNSRIEGTAVINRTNAIEINALPVVP